MTHHHFGSRGQIENVQKAAAREKAEDAQIDSLIEDNPLQGQKVVYAKLVKLVNRQLDRQLRARGKEAHAQMRSTVDVTKELRQTADRVLEIIRAEGAAAAADDFFATLATRLSAANLEESPRPYDHASR